MSSGVRVAVPEDAAAIRGIYEPIVRDTAISFEIEPPSVTEAASHIAGVLQHYPWLVFDSEQDGIIGYAHGSSHRSRPAYRWSVDVSIYVADSARGQGAGRALYTSLLDILAGQGYVNAFAGITLPNPASVDFHESFGFEPLGIYRGVGFKAGAWHDVGWWSKRLAELAAAPKEPVPFRAFQSRDPGDT